MTFKKWVDGGGLPPGYPESLESMQRKLDAEWPPWRDNPKPPGLPPRVNFGRERLIALRRKCQKDGECYYTLPGTTFEMRLNPGWQQTPRDRRKDDSPDDTQTRSIH